MTDGAERRIDELEVVIAHAVKQARSDQQQAVDSVGAQTRPVGELTDLVMQREAFAVELSAKLEAILD